MTRARAAVYGANIYVVFYTRARAGFFALSLSREGFAKVVFDGGRGGCVVWAKEFYMGRGVGGVVLILV